VVGVNAFANADSEPVPVLEVDPRLEQEQVERLGQWRAERDGGRVAASLDVVRTSAAATSNLMAPMREALATGATIGEVSDALRDVFGVHRPSG